MQFTGQGEDHMKVVSRQKLLLPAVEPLADPVGTAARTRTMAARVIPDLRDVPLRAVAHVPAQHRRATGHHGACGPPHPAGHLVRFSIRRKARLEDVPVTSRP